MSVDTRAMPVVPPLSRPATTPRVEIQGLRALAVSLVVLYHLAPARLPGGYVGVDVFFVVSGFLITSHLLREVERTGRIRLGHFWARRARRLLPAALLVLAATAVTVLLAVPQALWQQFMQEIGASALYVENWALAFDAVDYLAADNAASPTQHYWSLSTEEQFYLVWPLLILLAGWLALRAGARRRTVLGAVLVTVVGASFLYSLWATTNDVSSAYFATPARAWEFGLGGLLALFAADPLAGRRTLRTCVSWAGFLAIGYAGFVFTGATPFPGTAALVPVLGTVAVIWAGAPDHAWSPTRLTDFGPVTFAGDISYSAYLWHWPPIILLPFVLGHDLGTRSKIAILVFTVVAAWATKVWVEDPVRTGTPLARRGPGATFLATAVATGLVVGTAGVSWGYVQHRVDQARAAAEDLAGGGDPCFGAGAMDPDRGCADPHAVTPTVDPTFAKSDRSAGMECLVNGTDTALAPCEHDPGRPVTLALLGDSHAASLWEAVTAVADQEGWSARLDAHSGCPPFSDASFTGPTMPADQPPACARWSADAVAALAGDPTVQDVLVSYRSDIYKHVAADGELEDAFPADTIRSALQPLVDAGKRVHVVRAVPTTNGVSAPGVLADLGVSAPDCIASSDATADPCAGPRDQRVVPDYLAQAVEGMPGADVVDLTDLYCDARTCHEVIGGVVVYWDGSHITATFSRTLAPFLQQALERAR